MSKKEIRNFLNNTKENPVGLIQEEELKVFSSWCR